MGDSWKHTEQSMTDTENQELCDSIYTKSKKRWNESSDSKQTSGGDGWEELKNLPGFYPCFNVGYLCVYNC